MIIVDPFKWSEMRWEKEKATAEANGAEREGAIVEMLESIGSKGNPGALSSYFFDTFYSYLWFMKAKNSTHSHTSFTYASIYHNS